MSETTAFYHSGSLELQYRLDTRRLAEHIAKKYVSDELNDGDIALISDADSLYLATADALGRPDCSYKGGLPGFVHILDRRTLAFPSIRIAIIPAIRRIPSPDMIASLVPMLKLFKRSMIILLGL